MKRKGDIKDEIYVSKKEDQKEEEQKEEEKEEKEKEEIKKDVLHYHHPAPPMWIKVDASIPQKQRLLNSYVTLMQMLTDRGYMIPKMYSSSKYSSLQQFLQQNPPIADALVAHMLNCTVLMTTRLDPEKETYFAKIKEEYGDENTPPPLLVVFMCRDEKLGIRSIGGCVSAMHKLNQTFEQIKAKVNNNNNNNNNKEEEQAQKKERQQEPTIRHALMLCDGMVASQARKKIGELQYRGRKFIFHDEDDDDDEIGDEVTKKDSQNINEKETKEEKEAKEAKEEKEEKEAKDKKEKDKKKSLLTAKAVIHDAKKSGYTIEAFQVDELQKNVSKHRLVPRHQAIYGEERKKVLDRFRGPMYATQPNNASHFPRIWVSDPQIRYLGLAVGTLVKVSRHLVNQQIVPYYRVVVPDDSK